MPAWLRTAPILLAGGLCLAFQARLSYDWVAKESFEAKRVRRPFNIRLFDSEGLVDFVFPDARDAGLAKGDRILAIDGQSYGGTGGYYRALDRHAPGERLELRIARAGAESDIGVPLSSFPAALAWTPRDYVDLGVTKILTPLMSLALGLFVLWRRAGDRISWLVFAFLLSFSVLATGGVSYEPVRMVCQWEPAVRVAALLHMAAWLYAWPLLLLLFTIHFPDRASWDARRPWLKWLAIVPFGLYAIVRGVAFPAGVEALPDYRGFVQAVDTALPAKAWLWMSIAALFAAAAEVIRRLRAARDADGRRRLRILAAGSALAWIPFLGLAFAADFFGARPFFGWPTIVIYALLLLFPVTLVYLILVDRALDLGVTLREGLQYTLARRSLFAIQILVVAAVVVALGVRMGEPDLRLPVRMQSIGLGMAAVMLSRRAIEVLGRWIDRRFFREQFHAGRLLSELAQQAGATADRDRLRELVTSRIGATLHTEPVHLISDETHGFAGVLSRLSRERGAQRIDWKRPPAWVTSLDHAEASRLLDLRSELLLPVARQDRLMGFLSLGPRRSEQPYSPSDIAVLESVAAQTALALDNAQLTETVSREAASREVLSRELQIAREVQERLLPRAAPEVPGLDMAGVCVPAREVGGDSFDYLELPNGEWAIAIGDVAGKGVSAALLMASLQASVRGLAADGIRDLPELMARLNRLMYDATPANRFVTFQLGVWNPATRALRLCSAGHNPALHAPAHGEPEWLRPKGVALGLVKQAAFAQIELTLASGDLLLLYTDGVTEAMKEDGEQFGEERLQRWAAQASGPSEAMARQLVMRVDEFAGEAPQHDDITVIAIRALA